MTNERKILIVEDSRNDAMVESYLVEQAGFVAVTAVDGYTALKRLADQTFEVILIDLTMPEMSGLDLLKHIRSVPRLMFTPVMVVSGRNEIGDVTAAIQLGANDYLVKPVDPEVFQNKLDHLLGAKQKDWYEYTVDDNPSETQVSVDAGFFLVSLNEVQFTLSSPFPVPLEQKFVMSNSLLKKIGMDKVVGKVIRCEERGTRFFVSFTYMGITEEARTRIRIFCRSLWAAREKKES